MQKVLKICGKFQPNDYLFLSVRSEDQINVSFFISVNFGYDVLIMLRSFRQVGDRARHELPDHLSVFLAMALAVAYDVTFISVRFLSTDSSISPSTVLASFSHLVRRSVPHVGFSLVPYVERDLSPSPVLLAY